MKKKTERRIEAETNAYFKPFPWTFLLIAGFFVYGMMRMSAIGNPLGSITFGLLSLVFITMWGNLINHELNKARIEELEKRIDGQRKRK